MKSPATDWTLVTEKINNKGFAVIPEFLSHGQCKELIRNYDQEGIYRKKVLMERYRFGLGEYKYFKYPLPDLIVEIRERIYPRLVPLANSWMKQLKIDREFPASLQELLDMCHRSGQLQPTPLILKYKKGGFNTLHQDLYGDLFFPMQAVVFLNQPGEDYSGGEFVMTQQTPRAQSKAVVLSPKRGDMMIFTTNFHPVKGSRGHYRVNMKHGISEVHQGERHTLGIIFHDAAT